MALTGKVALNVVTALRKLEQIDRNLDVEALLDDAAALQLGRIRQRFIAQVDTSGRRWVPSRAAIRENRQTLIKTGDLFRSIQAFRDSANVRRIGTSVKYAPFHQFGAPPNIKREFIGFSQADVELIDRLVSARVQAAING